ncbi:SBP (S-ribonuclease binding protein) family protein [Rhynchospora pubera]|uniref:SBP (S-ribonuclease binding protein) family protein n=1 Tax=Rhynchospora pubera TaxID=906938 RepID=A0AAV8C9H9_9POAL|nr:SBP (S-ribonuclease binding protein) family protein [Rhynchospora pubera]
MAIEAQYSLKRTRDHLPSYALLDPTFEMPAMPIKQARLDESGFPSTSGRVDSMIISHFNRLNAETDALLQLHMERTTYAIKELTKRQYISMLVATEKQAALVLKQKQDELDRMILRNAELEQQLNQVNAEKQVWFNMAKNNEAIAASLRSNLEQVLIQNNLQATCSNNNNENSVIEGCGDSDEVNSTCFDEKKILHRHVCKVCRHKEASVLLLPCRHLSICEGCEHRVDLCPVCHEKKKSSVPVLIG